MARKYTDEEKTLIRVHWALVLLMAILAGFCIGEIITATKEAAQIYYEEMELQDANQG